MAPRSLPALDDVRRLANSMDVHQFSSLQLGFEMTDDRNLLEYAESITEKACGQPATIDDIADNFALYGLNKRVVALDGLEAELDGEIGSGSHSLRRHVRLQELRRRMTSLHHALRRAKR